MEGVCSAQVQAQTSTAEDARGKDRRSICRQPLTTLISTWPREVEEVLAKHEGIAEAVVIGIPNPVSGEAVKAFVVKKAGARLIERELIDFCRDRIAVYKAPREVDFIDALPRNLSGKVLKRELRLREPKKEA